MDNNWFNIEYYSLNFQSLRKKIEATPINLYNYNC